MILTSIFLALIFLVLHAECCIVADKADNHIDPLLGNAFDNPQNLYAFTELTYDCPSLIANVERNLKFWATWNTEKDKIKVKSLNRHSAAVDEVLHITAMVAQLDLPLPDCPYFLLVLQDSHIKYIGKLSESGEATKEQSDYMNNVAKREEIPIWESCLDYHKQDVRSCREDLAMNWIKEKGYTINKIWATTFYTRYIFVIQHKKANESHAHYRFMSFTVEGQTPKINFVGGHMRTSRLAEYSASNFFMLDSEFTNGTWNDDAKVTWGISPVLINLQSVSESISEAIIGNVPEEMLTNHGLLEPLKVEYGIGLVPMSMPCPNSAKMEQLLCQSSVDHYWLQAVVKDKENGKHVMGLLLQFQNDAFKHIEVTEYIQHFTQQEYITAFNNSAAQEVVMFFPQVPQNVSPPSETAPKPVKKGRKLFRSNTSLGLPQVQGVGSANDSRTPQIPLNRRKSFLWLLQRMSSTPALNAAGARLSTPE